MRDVVVNNCREFYIKREFRFVVEESFMTLWM
jgi:hypothetical protein